MAGWPTGVLAVLEKLNGTVRFSRLSGHVNSALYHIMFADKVVQVVTTLAFVYDVLRGDGGVTAISDRIK